MGGNCQRSQPRVVINENKYLNKQISELDVFGPGRSSFLQPFQYDPKEQDDYMKGPGRQTYCEQFNIKFNSKLDEQEIDLTSLTLLLDQVDLETQNKSSIDGLNSTKEILKNGKKKYKGILKSNDSSFTSSNKSKRSVTFNPLKITRSYQKKSLKALIL